MGKFSKMSNSSVVEIPLGTGTLSGGLMLSKGGFGALGLRVYLALTSGESQSSAIGDLMSQASDGLTR